MMRLIIIVSISLASAGIWFSPEGSRYPQTLSAWKIYTGKLNQLKPAAGIVPYALNTPLFSDYAEKLRFIRLPAGTKANYTSSGVFSFPTGTLLIKNFYYSADMRKPGINRRIIETRLLIKEASAWKALTYIWNDKQTEAFLEIAGDEKQISFTDADGMQQQVRYVVPNLNQCRGCHNYKDQLMPIGLQAAQLNGNYNYAGGKKNQLDYWKQHGLLRNMPALATIAKTAVWNDSSTGDLNARARAYLSINCAHCHRREGPAQTSGLFLTENEKDSIAIGIRKTPVAAGQGSGGRLVDIMPGNADASIMWYRMQTHEPGERMPELGRTMNHKEGLALIREWIDSMK